MPPARERTGVAGGTRRDDVRYVQFMAKDNVPFHSISFPGTLFGSGEPWKMVDFIKGFNWLNYYGGKFSTSRSAASSWTRRSSVCRPTTGATA